MRPIRLLTPRFMPICLSSFLVTAAFLTPDAVRAAEPQVQGPPALAVVRVGDRAMTCEALAAEINTLAQPPVAEAKPRKKRGLGFLSALGGAVPFVGAAGMVGSALVSTAASGAAQMAAQGATDAAMIDANRMAYEAMNGGSPAQQRKERLTVIFEEKRC